MVFPSEKCCKLCLMWLFVSEEWLSVYGVYLGHYVHTVYQCRDVSPPPSPSSSCIMSTGHSLFCPACTVADVVCGVACGGLSYRRDDAVWRYGLCARIQICAIEAIGVTSKKQNHKTALKYEKYEKFNY